MARALLENEHVTEVVVFLGQLYEDERTPPADRWSELRRALATKQSLLHIELKGRNLDEPPMPFLMPREDLRLFFEAIQPNNNARVLILNGLPLSGAETAALLKNLTVSRVGFFECSIMESDAGENDGVDEESRKKEEDARAMLDALQTNEHIRCFCLHSREVESGFLPIVEGLGSMPQLRIAALWIDDSTGCSTYL